MISMTSCDHNIEQVRIDHTAILASQKIIHALDQFDYASHAA